MQAVLPAGVTYDSGAKSFTLDPTNVAFQSLASGATTTVTVNFDVTDGTSTTAASVSWTVTGVNDAPSLSPTAGAPDVSTGVVTGASGGTDDDAGDVLAFSVASNPSKGSVTLDPNTGAFTYTPTASARHAAAADGASTADLTDSFTVSVSDGHGGSTQAQVTVAIGPANAAPMLSPTVGTPDASTGVVTGTSGGTDADGDTLTFSVTSTPSMGTVLVDPNTGAFTYTPDAAARATAGPGTTDSFGLFVNDGHGGTALTSVTVIVAPLVASCSSATISVGMGPVGIAITPDGTRVYVSNFDDDTVSVIDTTTTPNTVVATIPVGDEPIDVAITPNGSWAYVTNSADNTVSVINTADYSVLSPISVGTSPYGVAIRPNGSEAYVVNSFSGTVSVIDTTAPNTGNPTISVGNGPFMLAISPDGTRVYVSNFDDSTLSVIDTTTTPKTVIDTISLGFGSGPYGIAFSPGGALAYVLAHLGNSMSVINTAQNSVTSTTFGLNYPYDIAITPDGTRAYVTNQGNDTVSVIDTTTNPNTVIDTISGFNTPYEIAITPDGTRAYVANRLGSSVSVICIPQGGNPN
jgi:YVTN family beta-propeller protein/VCBS repeat-containing protein